MITKTILVLLYLPYSLIIHPTKIKTTKPIKNAESKQPEKPWENNRFKTIIINYVFLCIYDIFFLSDYKKPDFFNL
jgi:hypothetical protein